MFALMGRGQRRQVQGSVGVFCDQLWFLEGSDEKLFRSEASKGRSIRSLGAGEVVTFRAPWWRSKFSSSGNEGAAKRCLAAAR